MRPRCSWPVLLREQDDGFLLMELVVAMALFLIVAVGFATLVSSGTISQRLSRHRTLAQEAAMTQIEAIRTLPYNSVGTVGGNPSGTIAASTTVSQSGINAIMTTQVSYVDDRAPTAYRTYADYKRVVVTVVRGSDSRRLAQDVTYIPPPGKGAWAGSTQGVIAAQIIDAGLNQPVAGATVVLATGPSAPRNDVTDANGTVTFPDLTPNPGSGAQSYYDLSVTAPGYYALKDDLSPSTAAHLRVAAAQAYSTVLRIYKPATINVTLHLSSGGLFSPSATIDISSPRGSQSFAITGGSLTIDTVAGEPLVPNLPYTVAARFAGSESAQPITQTVPLNYPGNLTSTFDLTVDQAPVLLTVTLKKPSGTLIPAGATVVLTGGPLSVNLTRTSTSSGTATFNVVPGAGYSLNVTAPAGTGSWTGSVDTTPTSIEVTVT